MNIFDQIILQESMMDESNVFHELNRYEAEMQKKAGRKLAPEEVQAARGILQRGNDNRTLMDKITGNNVYKRVSKALSNPSEDKSMKKLTKIANDGGIIMNLAAFGAKLASLAAKHPKLLIVLVNGIIIAVTSSAAYNAGFRHGEEQAQEGMNNKLIMAALGGALSAGLLAMGFKLIKHACTKSAAEVAASDKPKEEKLKTLNGLLSAAQKAVSKAKTADDKQLAQSSVDIIQRHISEVQAQAA